MVGRVVGRVVDQAREIDLCQDCSGEIESGEMMMFSGVPIELG